MWELSKFDVVTASIMRFTPHVVKSSFVDYGINSDGLILFEPWSVVVKIMLNEVQQIGYERNSCHISE